MARQSKQTRAGIARIWRGLVPVLFFVLAQTLAAEPVGLNQESNFQWVHEQIEVLVDASGKLTATEVAALDAAHFEQGFDRPPGYNGGDAPIWVRLRLANQSRAHHWILDFNRPRLDRIEAYVISPAGPMIFAQTGSQTPAALDAYPHRENVIRITLAENQSQQYLFRIENPWTRLRMAFQVFEEQTFVQIDRLESTILGLYFGIMFTMVVLNSFFFIALRDRAFILYALFLFFFGLVMLHGRGLDRQMFAALKGVDLHLTYYLLNHVVILVGMFFLKEFFRSKHKDFSDSLLKYTLIALSAHLVFVFGMILVGQSEYARTSLLLVLAPLPISIFSLVFSRLRRGEIMAVYILVGTGFLLSGVFIQVFQVRGLLPYNTLSANAMVIGSGIDMILISLGLSDRFRRLERQSERHRLASETKSLFLAHMSHEIRTPLNAVLGMSELLYESPLSVEQTKYLNVLSRSGRTLLNTINDILDLSKIEAGQLGFESIRFPPAQLLESLREVHAAEATGRGITLDLDIDESTPAQVQGDPTLLRQVINNLLSNAIKFTEEGSVILRLRRLADVSGQVQLHFEVEDTGIGITYEQRSRIFESFTQADDSTTRKYGGTGLGLAISRQTVELMGGRIGVESTPRKGSRFYFSLPFMPVDALTADQEISRTSGADAASVQTPTHESSPERRPLTILLAEDNEDNRMLFLAYLKRTAYEIDIAENGAEAVEHFLRKPYDVVFMDIQMPILSGLEAVRQIRNFESNRKSPANTEDRSNVARTPIFALTAHAFEHERKASLEAGCDGHITKPLEKSTLLEILSRLENSQPA